MYTDTTTSSSDPIATLFGLMIFAIAYALTAWLLGRVFNKAGIEQWKAWVPFYNTYTFLEMGGQKGLYVLLTFIPFVGGLLIAIFQTIAAYKIGAKFQKPSMGWAVLYFFIPLAWYAVIAFDDSKWENNAVNGYNFG